MNFPGLDHKILELDKLADISVNEVGLKFRFYE